MILLLEDNAERIERFLAALVRIAPSVEVCIWRDAWVMLRELPPLLAQARPISLDRDLDPVDGAADDPGTGWDVTKVLAAEKPCCPAIVHTSNGERATWMIGEFELGGWDCHRILPVGEDWIENDWRRLARRSLGKTPD